MTIILQEYCHIIAIFDKFVTKYSNLSNMAINRYINLGEYSEFILLTNFCVQRNIISIHAGFFMNEKFKNIKNAIEKERVIITKHANEERRFDKLSVNEVLESILNGEIIEDYSDDKPLPSCLIFGRVNDKPIHVCVGYNNELKKVRIITVYIPNTKIWQSDLKTRRKK